MIKKIVGIATILLVILAIGIGIAKANPKVTETKQYGVDKLTSKQLKTTDRTLYAKNLKTLLALDKTLDTQKDLSAAVLKNELKNLDQLDWKDASLVDLKDKNVDRLDSKVDWQDWKSVALLNSKLSEASLVQLDGKLESLVLYAKSV